MYSDSFPWPFSAIFSKPVPRLYFKAFLTLRSRKGRNALCLLGRSQSNLETKNSHWKLRKKNIRTITARGGSRKSMSRGTGRRWSRTAIQKNPMRRGSAEKKVLSEFIITSEEPFTLYAVFKKQMTIGLMSNGGTLAESGEKESFTDFCYYNNGNSQSEPTTVPASPYTRKNMSFCGWSIDSLSTPSYKPGERGVFPAGATLYAMWVTTEYDFVYTGNYVQFVIPQDGIYEFEVWGASGGEAKGDSIVAEGGLGGHSKGYKRMKWSMSLTAVLRKARHRGQTAAGAVTIIPAASSMGQAEAAPPMWQRSLTLSARIIPTGRLISTAPVF